MALDLAAGAEATITETGVELRLAGGETRYFNAYWLRDNCPTSFDPTTRERVFDIFALEPGPRAARAAVVDGALEIDWAGERRRTRHPLERLLATPDGAARHDPSRLPRRAWRADHYPAMHRVSSRALQGDAGALRAALEALLVEGVVLVTEMPDADAALRETAERIGGRMRPTFFGEVFEVKLHIAPDNLAYTAGALEMHTDTPAEDAAPGVQLLHCRANSVDGGMSLFADAVAAAEDLRAADPAAFALLAETDIPFYCEHDAYDMRSRQRVIELDRDGVVEGVTLSQHMADVFDLPQRTLDAYYPAFCKFGRMLSAPAYVMRFRLNAGECIVFDNHRIVHGREAYVATSGERWLRGTYVDRGEMRSRYRRLVAGGRIG